MHKPYIKRDSTAFSLALTTFYCPLNEVQYQHMVFSTADAAKSERYPGDFNLLLSGVEVASFAFLLVPV